MRGVWAATFSLALGAGGVAAHDGHAHPPVELAAPGSAAPMQFLRAIGGPFALTDQSGAARTERDPDGRAQIVFFGYATCPGICSTVLPALGALTNRLAEADVAITPVLITIDPLLDTQASLAVAAPKIHPELVALTGSEDALAAARDDFQVEAKLMFTDPRYGPIYAHGSYLYLLDAKGAVLTLLPPILGVERMAEIVLGYLSAN